MVRVLIPFSFLAASPQMATPISAQQCSCDTSFCDDFSKCGCDAAGGCNAAGECSSGCEKCDSCQTRERLLGDVFGSESCLMDCGITSDIIFGQYYQGVPYGLNERTDAYGGKVDYYFTYGGGKSSMPKGLSISLHAETRYGSDITSAAGGLTLPVAPMLLPLPGDYHGTNITGLMITQSLFDGKADVFFGKLNAIDLVTGFLPYVGSGRVGLFDQRKRDREGGLATFHRAAFRRPPAPTERNDADAPCTSQESHALSVGQWLRIWNSSTKTPTFLFRSTSNPQ